MGTDALNSLTQLPSPSPTFPQPAPSPFPSLLFLESEPQRILGRQNIFCPCASRQEMGQRLCDQSKATLELGVELTLELEIPNSPAGPFTPLP